WFPHDLIAKHYRQDQESDIVYFAGCTASYVENDIAMATTRLLDAAGVEFNYLGKEENCCGIPMLVAGKWDDFIATMKKNIAAVKNKRAKIVIASCPACDMMWRKVYPEWSKKLGINYDIKAKHYSEIVADKIKNKEFAFPDNNSDNKTSKVNVTWHDSCHIGRASGVYDAPREIIKAIPDVNFIEMENNCENAHCCGSVLTLIKEPAVAEKVGKIRLDEAVEAGAQKVLSLCPCCEFQFRVTKDKKKIDIDVNDLARFAASALGYDFPEPEPEVQKQWAVFEAMIALMTPEGFSSVMKNMWPQLIDAMPLKMGTMMRFIGKIPGSLKMFKPLFPVLFPILLPKMMPKVMAPMISIITGRIPMPDYMIEQMPQLMPKVMDNLMPHMVGDVIPLVVDDMIRFLHGV
ncbi:MAG: (Fe-S)-binding protein, partial [Actinobacteria bacterium]|nr:(Fe-S)-binding protein [Actinomycetota bacterium]